MKQFKRWVTALVLAASLGSAVAPLRNAQAGLIFLPVYGVGLFFILVGITTDNEFLVILDNNSPSGDALEQALVQNYGFIGDRAVIGDLASAIRTKARSTAPDAAGRRNVRLERSQVLQILEPTGLPETSPTEVARLISDLS